MEPRERIILAIRVIVALLCAPYLVTRQQHGDALGENQRGQEVALLLPPECLARRVVGRSLGPTVPTVVLVGAVLIIVTIRVVVLVIVADQVVQCEAIMAGDEIDASRRLAPVILIEVATAAQAGGKF